MKPGVYRAVPGNYWLESKNDKVTVCIEFNVIDQISEKEADKKLIWYGYLTDKAKGITIKTLAVCGFRGNDIADLVDQNMLDTEREVFITIENEVFEGKIYTKIKWVNATSRPKLDKSKAIEMLRGLSLRSQIESAKKEFNNEIPF